MEERSGYKASRGNQVIFGKGQGLRLKRCWMVRDERQGEQLKAPRGLVSNGLGGEVILNSRLANKEMCAEEEKISVREGTKKIDRLACGP